MTRAATSDTARKARTAALRGPLLSLLIQQQQPTHAYKLTTLLNQCLPEWRAGRATVADLLDGLEADGIISSFSDGRKVYLPADRAQHALDEWMQKAVRQPPIREELHAMIACSSRRHAPMLLRALDTYQRECSEQLSTPLGGETSPGSWRSLTINLVRAAADEQLQARIAWARNAQEWIKAMSARDEPLGWRGVL